MEKLRDVVVYHDDRFYSAFPSVVCRDDGELIVAFRRAPNRRPWGTPGNSHADPNSHTVLVRSRDNGATWTDEPELICAHPLGGSQDPCMVQLRDGTLLCASYLWVLVPDPETSASPDLPQGPRAEHVRSQSWSLLRSMGWTYAFGGGYLMRSTDGGAHWEGPIEPPALPGVPFADPLGRPLPAFNRGAMLEGRDGTLYWAVARRGLEGPTSVHLIVSGDGGTTWEYRCPVAEDDQVTFNETSLYETASGDLVAFIRTAGLDDRTVVARSRDGGRSFEAWQDTGFQGHPHHALRLPDGRVFLVYGYRHKPYGVRARILDPECANPGSASEIVLRDDGATGDLGYPWATLTADGRVLAVYYILLDRPESARFIGGTLLGP